MTPFSLKSVFITFLLVTLNTFSQSRWTQREFILGTFWDPQCNSLKQTLEIDTQEFKRARNAHFNLLSGIQATNSLERTFEGVRWALTIAYRTNLKYLVVDERFFPAGEIGCDSVTALQIISQYRSLPKHLRDAYIGYNLMDEPNFSKSHFENIRNWKKYIERFDSEKLAYVNLVASYAVDQQWGNFKSGNNDGILDSREKAEYETYLTYFIDSLQLSVVSYDHYPFFKNGVVRKDYFYNLAIMRKKASNRPLWCYPMTVGHLDYVDPTPAHLRFMYFAPIAYGVKGLIAFSYATPQSEDYSSALIDKKGNETSTYTQVQQIQRYILKIIAPVVMNVPHRQVIHSTDFPGQLYLKEFTGTDTHLITSIQNKKYLVGVFQNPNTFYLFIINKSLHPEPSSAVVLNGSFKEVTIGPRLKQVTDEFKFSYRNFPLSCNLQNTTTTVVLPELDGGEGILLNIKSK